MEDIRKFFEKIGGDEELQARIKAELEVLEGDAKLNRIVEIAKELGFNFTVEDFNAARTELSEEDLDNVAGGGWLGDAFNWVKDKIQKGAEVVSRLISPSSSGGSGGGGGSEKPSGSGTTVNVDNKNTNSIQQSNVEGDNKQNDVVLQN